MNRGAPRPFRLLSNLPTVVGWVVGIRLVSALGFALSIPFLTLYLHEELSIPMSRIGLMLSAAGLLGASASTLGGTLSDTWGRRRLLVMFLLARAAAFVGIAAIVYLRLPFLTFAAVWVVSAVLGTSIFPLMDAAVADVTGKKRRSEAYATLRVAANVGWAVGPALGGILVAGGYHLLFLATSLALMTAALLARLKLVETWRPGGDEAGRPGLAVLLRDKVLLRFLMVCLLLFLVQGQLIATVSVHASASAGMSKAQIGLLYVLNGLMVVIFQVPVTRLLKRFEPLQVLAGAGVLYAVAYTMVGQAHSPGVMYAAMAFITTAEVSAVPTAVAYVSGLAQPGRTGGYMGAYGFIIHLGWTVGPLFGGVLMDLLQPEWKMWGVVSLTALVAAAGFLAFRGWLRRRGGDEPLQST